MGFLTNLGRKLSGSGERNCYLQAHGHYRRNAKECPILPYSLEDLLTFRQSAVKDKQVVIHHGGHTAHWFAAAGSKVVLGRKSHHSQGYPGVTYCEDLGNWHGSIDLLILDNPADWGKGAALLEQLASGGVVIVSGRSRQAVSGSRGKNYPPDEYYGEGLNAVQDALKAKGFRFLRFTNPGPGFACVTADLWYADGNFLGI